MWGQEGPGLLAQCCHALVQQSPAHTFLSEAGSAGTPPALPSTADTASSVLPAKATVREHQRARSGSCDLRPAPSLDSSHRPLLKLLKLWDSGHVEPREKEPHLNKSVLGNELTPKSRVHLNKVTVLGGCWGCPPLPGSRKWHPNCTHL